MFRSCLHELASSLQAIRIPFQCSSILFIRDHSDSPTMTTMNARYRRSTYNLQARIIVNGGRVVGRFGDGLNVDSAISLQSGDTKKLQTLISSNLTLKLLSV